MLAMTGCVFGRPPDAGVLVRRWANEVCLAPSASAGDLARALSLDLGEARRLGRQRIFLPSHGISRLEFVVGPGAAETVLFIEFATKPPMKVDELTALLGPGQKAPPGPHQVAPIIIFDDVWPQDAVRGCSVMARLADSDPQVDAVDVVILHPRVARR